MVVAGVVSCLASLLSWARRAEPWRGRCRRTKPDAAPDAILDLFSSACYDVSMTADLRPAIADEIAAALSFALRYRGA
jgi:hypothetical protein